MIFSSTSRVQLDDGASTTIERWGTKGPVMLCVHGMTSSRRSWERVGQRYGDRFRVVAYDQRGHGDSAGISGPMSLDRGERDLENVAAAIGGAHVLLGHSWGGTIVIRAGERLDVRAVAAVDPMIVQAPDDWYREYIAELDESFQAKGVERDLNTRAEFRAWHRSDVEGKVHAVHSMTSDPIAGLQRENTAADWDLRATIARYDRPLLLAMAGRDESVVPPEVLDDVEATRRANVQIVVFGDQGHSLHRTGFDAFALVLDIFLANHAFAS